MEYMDKIRAAIDANWEDQMKTLKELVAFPSVDEGPARVVLEDEFEEVPVVTAAAETAAPAGDEAETAATDEDATASEGEAIGDEATEDEAAEGTTAEDPVAAEAAPATVRKPKTLEVPFGKAVHEAFLYALDKGEAMGFDIENADNFGGHIEMPGYLYDEAGEMIGTAEETLGIVGHLDVVPAGDGWEGDPFVCEEKDGMLVGRGTQDDKGPVVAALYAMKALADAGYTPHTNVRLILGLDEETRWDGLHEYLARCDAPDFGFSPDGDFPVIQGEMGILIFDLARKFNPGSQEGLQLRSITGGNAPNMVADSARAILLAKDKNEYEFIKQMALTKKESEEMDIRARVVGKSLELSVQGVSAHGARPQLGINAVTDLLGFLGELNFANDDVNDFLAFCNEKIGKELNGDSLGCHYTDDISGDTIVNVGMINVDQKAATLTLCIRYPVTVTGEQIFEGIAKVCEPFRVGIIKDQDKKPIYKPDDDPMIKTMMDVYREHTGDTVSKPLIIGGGTYARAFDNMVAFGALFPGTEDLMHQKGEALPAGDFRKMTEIYADTIYRLAVK